MRKLPDVTSVPVVRIDFSDDEIWAEVWAEIISPADEGVRADVEYVEDHSAPDLDAVTWAQSLQLTYPTGYPHPVLFVADAFTMAVTEGPLLVVDLHEEDAYRSFRCTPRAVQTIQGNLSRATLEFEEFADSSWTEKIFRGF